MKVACTFFNIKYLNKIVVVDRNESTSTTSSDQYVFVYK